MGGKPVATKKNYSRYFIILQEDEKGYSTDSSKFPTGYAKVERKNEKCKVSYYVQNLKRSKNPYYMILICDRKADKRLLKLGKINIDDYGRAEVSCEYSAENIASSNIPMESIKGAAIVSLEDSSVHGILTGFVSGSRLDDWKSYAVIENQESENRIELGDDKKREVETKNQKEEDNIFDKYENDIEKAKNIKKETSTVPNISVENREDEKVTKAVEEKEIKASIDEKFEEALTPTEEEQIKEKDDNRNKGEDHHEHDHEHHHGCEHEEEHEHEDEHEHKCEHEHDHEYEHYNEEDEEDLEEFFEDISEGFEEVKDICKEVGECKWHKVPYEKLMNVKPYMHFNKYTMVYYPMFNYQPHIRKGGHYLFGYKLDSKGQVKYLVYAIPGTRKFLDQPYGGNSGFVTWVYKDDKKSDDGYWLMFYDFRNSRIVVPVKK